MFLYQFEEKWEELGWSVSYDDNDTVELSQGSPAGEDFYFTVPKLNFCDEVFDYANDFDPEEHAKENIGMSGAPGLRELLDDADAIKRMLLELSEALCKVEREATRWYLIDADNFECRRQFGTEEFEFYAITKITDHDFMAVHEFVNLDALDIRELRKLLLLSLEDEKHPQKTSLSEAIIDIAENKFRSLEYVSSYKSFSSFDDAKQYIIGEMGTEKVPELFKKSVTSSRSEDENLGPDEAVFLTRCVDEDYESVEETVAISKRWLENNIKETADEEMSDLETFLRNYTTDDVNEVLGMAILNNAVAFTYCDARKEAFEMYGTESWMAMAVVDFVASKLEGLAEGNNAASMVKKLFAR